jgi:primosomal protein N' (replication factor Y)
MTTNHRQNSESGRVVRVLPDVAGIDKTFDYSVPAAWATDGRDSLVAPGAVVRIDLHGRRVGGWIVAVDVDPPPGVVLRPLAKVSGMGPPAEIIELAGWVAWRWAGRLSTVLTTASPPTLVHALPSVPSGPGAPVALDPVADDAFTGAGSVVRIAPGADTFDIVLAAARRGNALVVAPSVDDARHVAGRLRRSGIAVALHPRDWALGAAGATVVGARGSVFAPVRGLSAIVVLDEHDEALQEERVPTWHARDVALERARRANVPCVLVSAVPTLEALSALPAMVGSRAEERAGWPIVDVIDRRRDDPARAGLLGARLVPFLRGDGPVACVLNRTGRARLLACDACGEIARCEKCAAAVVQGDDGVLSCRHCGTTRPVVCAACGATKLRNLRAGVSRVREEIEALAQRPVVEVTGALELGERRADVYVGTEALLHQLPDARVVIFLDFDQELLAPRARAAEQAMALLARAARLVGGRTPGGRTVGDRTVGGHEGGGRVVVQTRVPRHEVLDAAVRADPGRLVAVERERRRDLRLSPFAALALVSGAAAEAFVARLGTFLSAVEVQGPLDGRYLLRAPDHRTLCDAIAAVDRPPGRLRIEVDPLRL